MIDAVVFITWNFNIWHVCLENAYSRPKNWGFWAIWSPKWDTISTKAKEGTPLRVSALFEPLSVKMWWAVWPVGELLNKRLCYGRGTARRACQYKFCNYKISLSCGIICVILQLAVFTQYRSVTDTHTHTQWRTGRYMTTACTALAVDR